MKRNRLLLTGTENSKMRKVFLFLAVAVCFCMTNEAMAQDIVDYGTTGDCTWILTGTSGDYTLTISGNGAMGNYDYYSNHLTSPSPWDSYRSYIKTLDIQQGVTYIGDFAFYACTNLTSITIPNSVKAIGELAFYNCHDLPSVTIPNSVTSIEYLAFGYCYSLKKFVIADGNTVLSFNYSSPTYTNPFFASCPLDTIYLGRNITFDNTYTHADFSYDDLSPFYDKTTIQYLTIGNQVTAIREDTFYGCSGLTTVNYNAINCTAIGDYGYSYYPAFSGCSNITTLNIGEEVETIPAYAFYGWSGLTTVNFNAINCTTMGSSSYPVFSGCNNITTLNIDSEVQTIPVCAFWGCSGLTSVTIPNSVTVIGGSAFSDCDGLTSITIGNSVTEIGDAAFYDCDGLTSITIGNSVTEIGDFAFSYCSGLTSLTIGNSVTKIGDAAFRNCNGLTSVAIPNSVMYIGVVAFDGCSGLSSLTIPNSVTWIGGYAFSGCNGLTSIAIPNSVTFIGNSCLANISHLKELTVPFIGTSTNATGEYTLLGTLFSTTTPLATVTTTTLFSEDFETDSETSLSNWTFVNDNQTNKWHTGTATSNGGNRSCYISNNSSENSYTTSSSSVVHLYRDFTVNSTVENPTLTFDWKGYGEGSYDYLNVYVVETSATIVAGTPLSETALATLNLSSSWQRREIQLPAMSGTKRLVFSWRNDGSGGSNPPAAIDNVSITGTIVIEENTGKYQQVEQYYSATGSKTSYIPVSLEKITVTSPATRIPYGAFYDCSFLKQVVISSEVTAVGQRAFFGCNSLTDIYALRALPPVAYSNSSFGGINKFSCTLHVPEGSKQYYSHTAAEGWNEFFVIEEDAPIGLGIESIEDSEIRLYPNPVRESFRIAGLTVPTPVTITDVSGKTVWQQTVAGDESISVGHLPQGIYLVRVNGRTVKTIKN
jgi:hypothetical protein